MLPNASNKAAVTENDVVMYVATGIKHLRLMALLICFSLLLGINYYLYSRPVYTAKSLIRYRSFARPIDSQNIWHDNNQQFLLAQIRSRSVIERTARRLGVSASHRRLFEQHIRRLRLGRDGEKNITIEIHAYSFPLARDWARVMLQEYLAYREERRLDYAEKAIKTFGEEMADVKARMDLNSELKFAFKQTNELDHLLIELNELQQVPQQLIVIRHRLAMMEQLRGSLTNENLTTTAKLSLLDSLQNDVSTYLAQNLPGKPLHVGIGDIIPVPGDSADGGDKASSQVVILPSMVPAATKVWQSFDKEYHRLEREYAVKGGTFLPGHPQMVALKKQMNKVSESLRVEFETAFTGFKIDYAALLEKQSQLEKRLPDFEASVRRHDQLLAEYRRFQSGQLGWGNYYAAMAKKLETLDFGFDKERATFEYAGYMEPLKDRPVAPNRMKIILYALIIGMALAIAVPFLLEYLNTRISDVEQAEEAFQIRGLGVVPKIQDADADTLLLDKNVKPDYHLKENFRLIRTNLIMNSENGALPQVILVTSAMPQEGKTCVASNLALSFANKGEKTLLIDGDLRRGRVHRLFGFESKPGLSNLLRGETTLEQTYRVNGEPNLTVMPCGKRLNSASELLDNSNFSKLIEELRGKYQRIIIDSPPVLGLSETIIMQRVADGVLMVIWSDFTAMATVKAAVQTLQINGAKFSGFVLNRLDFSALGNRYKYFYYAPLYYSNYQPLPSRTGAEA